MVDLWYILAIFLIKSFLFPEQLEGYDYLDSVDEGRTYRLRIMGFESNAAGVIFTTIYVYCLSRLKYSSSIVEKTFFSILMIIPAFITFMGVLNQSKFNSSAKEFLKNELDGLKNKDYLQRSAIIKYNSKENQEKYSLPWSDKESEIVLNTFGLEPISKEAIYLLSAKIIKYPNLSQTKIVFIQQDIENDFKEDIVSLVDKYKENGYRDARVISDTIVAYNEKSITLKINLMV